MRRHTFTHTADQPWQSVQESTILDGQRVAPSGDCSSFTAQVAIPLFQALLTGAFVGGGSWLLWYAFVAPETAKVAGLAMALLGAGAAWLVLMADSRGLLRLYESFGSGARQEEQEEEKPQPPAERVVFVHTDQYHSANLRNDIGSASSRESGLCAYWRDSKDRHSSA